MNENLAELLQDVLKHVKDISETKEKIDKKTLKEKQEEDSINLYDNKTSYQLLGLSVGLALAAAYINKKSK